MADYIKGINVRNIGKQLTDWKGDYDIFDNYSIRGGQRSPYDGSYFGLTYPTQTDSGTVPTQPITDTTGTTDTTKIALTPEQQGWQTDYTNYLKNIQAQFQPLYDKYLNDLQTGYNTKKGDFDLQYGQSKDKLTKNYWDLANQNDKGFYNNLKNTESAYAGRNLQDSSFYNNSMKDINNNFQDYYGKIQSQYNEGLGSLDKQKNDYYSNLDKTLSTGRETADRIKNNFFNPQSPQFGSLEDLYSAKSSLDSQMDQIKNYTNQYQQTQLQAPTMSAPTMSNNQSTTQSNNVWSYSPTGQQTSPEKKPYGYQDTYWNNYFYPVIGG